MPSGEVYGVQQFVAGSDTELAAFASEFAWLSGPSAGAVSHVRASSDDIRTLTANTYGLYQLNTSAPADQRILADALVENGGTVELWVRMDANGDGYLAAWIDSGNPVTLKRITGSNASYTTIDSFGVCNNGVTYTDAMLEAITRPDGAVQLRYGDAIHGYRTFVDTAVNRWTRAGTAGVGLYSFFAAAGSIDRVRVVSLSGDAHQSTWSIRRGVMAGRR